MEMHSDHVGHGGFSICSLAVPNASVGGRGGPDHPGIGSIGSNDHVYLLGFLGRDSIFPILVSG